MSLQVEGASAVWAACDLLLQLQEVSGRPHARRVGVGAYSYHGPAATSLGAGAKTWEEDKAKMPLRGDLKPRAQLRFPVPAPFARRGGEDDAAFHTRMLAEFDAFLDAHAHELGVLLVEPQPVTNVRGTHTGTKNKLHFTATRMAWRNWSLNIASLDH